jgi:hypothetical protein
MFQDSPDSLNGVVFAVIGRVVGQSNVEFVGNGKLNHALHELSATRMILWAIILIDEQGFNVAESLTITIPPSI